MAAQTREAACYEDLAKELRVSSGRSLGAFNDIAAGIEHTTAIYRELSTLNLNPSTTLFTITRPFTQQTQRSLTTATVALYFVLIMMLLTLIVVPVGRLIHHAFMKHA